MTARRALTLVAALSASGALGAVGFAAGGRQAETGVLRAVVFLSPTCGVPEERGKPRRCTRPPYALFNARVRVRPEAGAVRTVRSGRDGRFRLDVPPGRYTLTPLRARGSVHPPPDRVEVTVEVGKSTDVIFDYYSGLT